MGKKRPFGAVSSGVTFTPPTHKERLAPEKEGHSKNWSLWRHYNWLDVGRTVVITGGTASPTASESMKTWRDPEDFDAADSGSGENGKAVFRAARTYSVNSTESAALTSAGYSLS